MSEILSQSEIDALLAALTSGEMNVEELKKDEEQKKIKTYDFKRALRFSKDQIRSLTRIHENFARLLTTYLSAQLRTYVQINVASVDQLPYDEFIRSIPKITILNVFSASPLEGRMVLEINPNITYAILERLMGGRGTSIQKGGSLTEIESIILEKVISYILKNFQEAWKNIMEIQPKLDVLEINPQFIQIVSPNETVAVISFNTKIGEATGMINLCLPHVVLEPVMLKLSAHYWLSQQKKVKSHEDYNIIENKIKNAKVPIIVELGHANITMQELINLSENDIITLEKRSNEPLLMKIGYIPKFTVVPGLVRGKIAVQINNVLEMEEGEET